MSAFIKSIFHAVGILILMSILAFGIIHAMPVNPAEIALLDMGLPLTLENINALEEKWGLNRPIFYQYLTWAFQFLKGNWGISLVTEKTVFSEFMVRLPYSLTIGLGGLGGAVLLCIPFGFFAAMYPKGCADKLSRIITVGTQSIPAFCIGLFLIWFLSIHFKFIQVFTGSFWQRLYLPTFLVCLCSVGSLTRIFRRELLIAMDMPAYQFARAKGLTRFRVLTLHAGRPALFGLLAAVTPECAWIIGGTSVVEIVFAIPGISQFLVDSINHRDYLVLQAYIMVIGLWMQGVHTLSMILRRILDPRV